LTELERLRKRVSELEKIVSSRAPTNDFQNLVLDQLLSSITAHVYWKNKDGVLLGCNLAQAKFLGYGAPNELIGKTDFDITTLEKAKEIQALDRVVMTSRKPHTEHEIFEWEGGEKVYFLSTKQPLVDEAGNVVGLIGISVDISNQKRAEELETENAIAQEKANTMKLFAATIAHELNSPLATISVIASKLGGMYPSLMALNQEAKDNQLQNTLSERNSRYLSEISQELKDVIEQTRSFTTMLLENVKASDKSVVIDCDKTINISDSIADAVAQCPELDKSLVDVDEVYDFVFKGNSQAFLHVLLNLLRNANYFIQKAGKGHIKLWAELGREENILHFMDTGTGIDTDILPHIFDQFYTKRRHGTGIGLAYCKLVMNSFGGKIECESKLDEYTHFKLRFPVV